MAMMIDRPSPAPASLAPGCDDDKQVPWEYSLRKYLLLLATLVATVTYGAGFSPPGGVWQEKQEGFHLAGDPILRQTSNARYVVFFYLNAGAFASSLVVIVLILILSVRHEMTRNDKARWLAPLHVLRGFMVLDLLTLIGAYTAGIYRDLDVPVYTIVLAVLTVVYLVVFHMVLTGRGNQNEDASEGSRKEREKPRKVLMLLATFALSVTYFAGLNAPGGFWNEAKDGQQPGEPILMGGIHETRLKVFVNLNSTAFFWSLLIAVQLLDKNLSFVHVLYGGEGKVRFRFWLLFASIVFALLGLVGAYVAGSCRETDATIYITILGAALPACVYILLRLINRYCKLRGNGNSNNGDGGTDDDKEARSLVLLLATLAATITYQAGLDPPGGLWESNGVDYLVGDPILRTKNHRRYNAFFYCNSVALVASLVAIVLVKKKLFLKTHALQAAMILDLFGLIGAYAAGSCREVSTSIYAMALAGAVVVYVVIHVLFLTLHQDTTTMSNNDLDKVVEKRRKRLLMFAILVATITYQAGLTPPGGFRVKDDEFGEHHAGDPVLLYNFRRRYNAFFYCNSVSFMLSMAMILLLVNKNLYKPAIQSHAISVCTAAGMLSLVGAYAAGSTQYMKTSIKIFGLVAAILIVLVAIVMSYVAYLKKMDEAAAQDTNNNNNADSGNKDNNQTKTKQPEHAERKYLMLLGILVASITYQAGLKPPGGMWQNNDEGHVPGNPVMHDNGKARYLSFFYINSTSFVASIIVVILLLLDFLKKDVVPLPTSRSHVQGRPTSTMWSLLRPMNTMIVLADLLGLLVAYAIGSSRSWKTTGYVFMLVFTVLAYIAIHVTLAHIVRHGFSSFTTAITNAFRIKKSNVEPEGHLNNEVTRH